MPPLLFASYEDINSIASTVLWVLLGIGFIALCIFAAIYAEKLRQQRIKDFIALAERHGFEYHPYGLMTAEASPSFWNFFHIETDGVVNALSDFPLFNVGHSKQAAPVLFKRSGGYEWLLFDYEYKITRSNGKSTTTTTYTNHLPPDTSQSVGVHNKCRRRGGRKSPKSVAAMHLLTPF